MSPTDVKNALAGRAQEFAQGLFPVGRLRGPEWQVGSLSGEPGKSLCIRVTGPKAGVFKDFATDEAGDNLVELYAQAKRLPYGDSLRACADWLGQALDSGGVPGLPVARGSRERRTHLPTPMGKTDCHKALELAATLRDNPELCERIARARNWRPETIAALACEPSLGWDNGKVAFLYESGVKVRWREDGERVIRWAFGEPWLWRGGFLWCRSTIYLCEGETDCISLIDAGVEDDGTTLAVALPSASTFIEGWAELLRGKDVVLVFDADKAGQDATERVSRFLLGPTKSLKQLNWRRLQNAS